MFARHSCSRVVFHYEHSAIGQRRLARPRILSNRARPVVGSSGALWRPLCGILFPRMMQLPAICILFSASSPGPVCRDEPHPCVVGPAASRRALMGPHGPRRWCSMAGHASFKSLPDHRKMFPEQTRRCLLWHVMVAWWAWLRSFAWFLGVCHINLVIHHDYPIPVLTESAISPTMS